MRNLIALLLPVFLILSGCGETQPQSKQTFGGEPKTLIKSMSFSSANNSKFGIDEVTIDGSVYLLVQDGGRATSITPKLLTSTISSSKAEIENK